MSSEKTISNRKHQSVEENKSSEDKELCCPECGSHDLVTNDSKGEKVCGECGVVIDKEQIDHGPDWRAFSHSDHQEKSRTGTPENKLMHDKGLNTKIHWQNKDSGGNTLSAEKRNQMKRLRKWDKRTKMNSSGDRNLQYALGEIKRMCSALSATDTVKQISATIYRRCVKDDLIRGRSIEGVASAAVYSSCRMEGVSRSLDEVCKVSRVEKLEISRTYRYICRELDLKIKPSDPVEYIPRFASELGVSKKTERKAKDIISECVGANLLSGKSPTCFAASALYLACQVNNEGKTQEDVAEVADVTPATIRNRYQEQKNVYKD